MNFDRFKEIDREVLETLGLTLDKVRMKSMSDLRTSSMVCTLF
jgi:hypothetical protein